jgi:membrane-anchored glycerophosphoryl diester phosphodiesterase (GDPDase)
MRVYGRFFLIIRLALFGPAIVIEGMDIFDAYSRSWSLTRDRWWRTFGSTPPLPSWF